MEVRNSGVDYDRESEVKAFNDSKAGVKGLVDAGLSKVPRLFLRHNLNLAANDSQLESSSIPVIDLQDIYNTRKKIIEKVGKASEEWGFFQVINHGIPVSVLDEMINGVRGFHEQDTEVKKKFYTRDASRMVAFSSNFDLFDAPVANWRDTLTCAMAPHPPNPHDLPQVCRDIMIEYSKQVMRLGLTLFELLSEALGLNPNHLNDMGCAEGLVFLGHYYPKCPEPELTLGTSVHSDSGFLTVLLQDQMGGLQVLHDHKWLNILPVHGAFVVNIGDLLQLISNDKFKSVKHRALTRKDGPRTSVASFFRIHFQKEDDPFLTVRNEVISYMGFWCMEIASFQKLTVELHTTLIQIMNRTFCRKFNRLSFNLNRLLIERLQQKGHSNDCIIFSRSRTSKQSIVVQKQSIVERNLAAEFTVNQLKSRFNRLYV